MTMISPSRPPWLQELIATGRRMGIPFAPLRPRPWTKKPTHGLATNRSVAALHLRTGEEIVVEVDRENEDYICSCLAEGPETVRFMWFETVDGCLVGVNLTHVDTVGWYAAGPNAPVQSPWKRDCVVARFSDGASMQLPEIRGQAIEYPKGATIRAHRKNASYLLSSANGRAVSVNLGTLTCVTMPAIWLDADP